MLMRHLGYGIGHKGQTQHTVSSNGVNQGRARPPLGIRRSAGVVVNSRIEQEGDSYSSEDLDEHSDRESEDWSDDDDDEDTEGCF